jgi:serine/threonine-protein kinase HipA
LLYSPKNPADRKNLDKAVERGQLRRIRARVYTDDRDQSIDQIIEAHFPAILSLAFPAWIISHSTAALLKPLNGSAYISSKLRSPNPAKLKSLVVNRLPALSHPELVEIETDDTVARSLTAEPEPVRIRVSSPLQNVFELLDTDARQPDRSLPLDVILGLIEALSERDKHRASAFAERNGLLRELARFNELRAGQTTSGPAARVNESLDLYYFHWRVGVLAALPSREFRFSYDENWNIELPGLPEKHGAAAYEGPGLPAFFDNLLPEGWAESRLRAVHKISREDTFSLLRTTQKYLSNFTLRPHDLDGSRLALDYLDVTLADVLQTNDPLQVDEQVGIDPDSREFWIELKRQGATRLSGVQPKLPVHLTSSALGLQIGIGHSANTSTHILKLPSAEFPQLVDNEWTTMELARRVGMSVPLLRRVEFPSNSELKSPGLLIERFDIPQSVSSLSEVVMLEEAATLLGITREDKYDVSLERVAASLMKAGLNGDDMDRFADHVVFSWITGNGDMHAKNIAILRSVDPGTLGQYPRAMGARYSPVYDLVNTTLVIRDDMFALSANGKRNKLRVNDFAAITRYWGRTRLGTRDRVEALAARVTSELPGVMERSHLSDDLREKYERAVHEKIEAL